MHLLNWNGKIVEEDKIFISPNNRSFRYGDGCFETMKVVNGNIILPELHFSRLFSSLEKLFFQFPLFFNSQYIVDKVRQLTLANHHVLARVRLTIYRGGDSWQHVLPEPFFLIQSFALEESSSCLNIKGLKAGLYIDAKKTVDQFSMIKSNNYQPYILGALWAKRNDLDDAIINNCFNRVADSTIANVFILSNGVIKTPAISEGCIDGTMRKYLLQCFKKEGIPFLETSVECDEILNASEVFFTNAITGIRWVEQLNSSHYSNAMSTYLYNNFIVPLNP